MANFRDGNLVTGQPLGLTSITQTLTADNTVINPNSPLVSMINLESDNTTATNRTFTLINGQIDGQGLQLVFTSGSSTTADLQDTGNVVLSAAWQPTQYDSLSLVWSARVSKWVEVARADN